MPTYDYRCKACDHRFELFQTMSEREKRKCPECGKNSLERLIGAGAGLIFKGSGYYLTDYRSKSYEEGAKADKAASEPASSSSEKSDGAKSESPKADASAAPKAESKPAKSAAKPKKDKA
jgi:putative FmdB family regulatory protein